MFKFKKANNRKRSSAKRAGLAGLVNGRLLEIVIAIAFGVVVLFVISMSVRITGGASETLLSPDYEVRLQILNGCGVNGLAGKVADELADYVDSDIRIIVVETDNFELRPVEKTFLISRDGDKSAARTLARKLHLPDPEILEQSLEDNYREVSATLVLGADWAQIQSEAKLLKGDAKNN
jgi:hypothetical protein